MQLFDLSGKVAVVTGGNGGIGLGMARGLARAGANIAVAARNADKSAGAVADRDYYDILGVSRKAAAMSSVFCRVWPASSARWPAS